MFFSVFPQNSFKVYRTYEIPELSLKFEMAQRLIEDMEIINDGRGKLYYEEPGTKRDNMTKSKPVNMIIVVKGMDDKIQKEIEIDYNAIDIDLSGFPMHYNGTRKFIVIRVGRYRFWLLNLSNFKMVGPLYSGVTGEASDSQDGSLSFLEVFSNGQYLIGYAWGFGIFCYNLLDLYNPVLVNHICTEKHHNHKNYFFLDHRIDNIYNGIVIKNHSYRNYEPAEFLFQGIMLELDENRNPIKEIIDDRFIKLNSIEGDGTVTPIVVDFIAGESRKQ